MKFRSIIAIAATGLLAAACQSGTESKSLADLKNATAADSLIYYFGQMRGAEYLRQAENDTTLAQQQSRTSYLQGVQAGMSAVKSGNEAYNRGLFLGMQMAMNVEQFKEDYDVVLDKKLFVESLANAINADSITDMQDVQREFYKIMGQFNEQKETRDREAAAAALGQEAKKLNMPKISDDVYGMVTAKTDSVQLKNGDNIRMDIKLADASGKELQAPLPTKGKIGARNLAAPINDMLKGLKSGETGKYVTSAKALFGQRAGQLGLEPSDVVTVTLKASLLPATKEDEQEKRPNIRLPR